MRATQQAPQFLLFSHAIWRAGCGGWRFVLQSATGDSLLSAEGREAGERDDRLHLWAVVRGLEALDQPSRVTLVTTSRYVGRGFRFGLARWRTVATGELAPDLRDGDLWRRVDRALDFHQVDCRRWLLDTTPPTSADTSSAGDGCPQHALRGGRQRSGMLAWLAGLWRPRSQTREAMEAAA